MRELTELQRKCAALLPDMELRFDEPMSNHTSFRIGGGAEIMAFPKTREELADILKVSTLLDCNCAILGAGTNVLAPDGGLPGVVICLKDCLDGLEQTAPNRIRVMAGVTMARAAVFAANLGLSGLEFAHGIPGSVGGGVYMNAGAYGGTTGEVLESVRVYVPSKQGNRGSVVTLEARDLKMGYRKSRVHDDGLIVLSATFKLSPSSPAMVRSEMDDYRRRREEKQPLELPSAGSTFKRPEGYFAGKLIMDAGLRGARVGDAQVSEKHCGFVVNVGRASAKDVLGLIEHVQDEVKSQFGVDLEPEVRMVGEF